MQVADEKVFLFQGYTLDLRRGCLRRADLEVELRPKSFSVLRYLVENAGRLVSKDELIGTVWTNVSVADVSLARCVSDVRIALQDRDQRIIRTVPRRGYLFALPVSHSVNASVTADPVPGEAQPGEAQFGHRPGERRQLTVMSCELAGLAALASRLDPEDLREATTACHRRGAEIIERHHGYVARYADDSLLAWFGYPTADEHDAENSVRAALTLQGSAAQFGTGVDTGLDVQLRPCIGIATGIVVVGDDLTAGPVKRPTAVGETVTLAGRLREFAQPGQIVIAQGTRRHVGGVFEYHDLGHVALKGLAAPVEISQVLGESDTESRFDAHHPAELTPLVGREEEIELLLRRWRQAKGGEGSAALVSGEPGIGKSRIVQSLQERLDDETLTRVRLFCSPHHQDSALHPFIRQLERAAGFRRSDTDAQRLTKLETALGLATSDLGHVVPLLADLLSIPIDDRYERLTLTPQQRKEKTFQALVAQVEGLAALRPVLLVVEDMHWADPTTLELIDLIIEQAPQLRLLVVVTFRPEFGLPWAGRANTSLISVGRLPPRQCAEIIAGVSRGMRLPRAITDEILERTDGVPLFAEELTKAVIESGALVTTGDGCTVAEPRAAPAIPMTLQASLLARLDRLAPAREVAQIGAALGRRFSHHLISAVAAMPQQRLDDALARLVGAGLIWRRSTAPDAEYTFKHALIQDAAYGTLMRESRRALHARIAETLESQFSDIAESQPGLMAHHCTEAGQIEKAATLWGKAGQLSLTRSALQEAAAQLARALRQIESLPGTAALRRQQIKLQIALANALMHTKGYAAPETEASLDQARRLVERAEALGEPPEDPLLLLSVLHGFWVANHVGFNGDAVRELAVQFMAIAEKQGTTFPLVLGHRLMGTSLLFLGEIAPARTHLDRAVSLYDPNEHRPLATRFGHDVGVAILSNRPLALWLLGHPGPALKDCDDALRCARDIGQAATYLYALARIASFHLVSANYAAAAAQSQELITVGEEIDGAYWKAAGTMIQGCLFALTGKTSAAIPMITSGMTASRATGSRLRLPWNWSCLARAYAGLGQLDEAWRCLGEAMTAMQDTKETWQESDLHRIAGDLTLLSSERNAAEAQAHFDRAIAVAREQAAKAWELRAATSLARLWRNQGKRRQAHDLLAAIYVWFTEGFDTPDLKEANALLAELA